MEGGRGCSKQVASFSATKSRLESQLEESTVKVDAELQYDISPFAPRGTDY